MNFRLRKLASGALAVHDDRTGETMHPGDGPWAEAQRLYVGGTGLERLLSHPGRGSVVVFDVGLGAAANALAALACYRNLAAGGRARRPLHLVSFENDPAALAFAVEQAQALGYPRGHEAALTTLLHQGEMDWPDGSRWELRLGDFPALIGAETLRADAVFFDPFSPRSNPRLWAVSTLEAIHRCRRPGTGCRLVTYSSSFSTRAALLLAGFYVGEGPAGWRAHTTAAATYRADLAAPLSPTWLGAWRKAQEPWPALASVAGRPALRAALLEHPQWVTRSPEPHGNSGIRHRAGGRGDGGENQVSAALRHGTRKHRNAAPAAAPARPAGSAPGPPRGGEAPRSRPGRKPPRTGNGGGRRKAER